MRNYAVGDIVKNLKKHYAEATITRIDYEAIDGINAYYTDRDNDAWFHNDMVLIKDVQEQQLDKIIELLSKMPVR